MRRSLTVFLLLCVAARAHAQDSPSQAPGTMGLSLAELMTVPVVAASGFEQRTEDAPSYVTVIQASEIRKYGWRTLAELLRSVPGLFTTNDRAYAYVGVRGFQPAGDVNTKLLFLIDGHRVNDELYNQGYVLEDMLVDLDLVDRVEVVRGPGSALYGSNAFLGVVNVITRRAAGSKTFEVSAEAGTEASYRARLSLGHRFSNGAELLVSGSGFTTDGFDFYFPAFDTPSSAGGRAVGLDGDRNRRFFGSVSFKGLTLEASGVTHTKHVPTSSYSSVFPDPTAISKDVAFFVEARVDRTYRGTRTYARVSLDGYRYESLNTIEDAEYNPEPPYRFLLSDNGEHRTAAAEVKIGRTIFKRHGLTLGAEYRGIFRQVQHTYVKSPAATILEGDHPVGVSGVYVQDEFRVAPQLILNMGARLDHYSTSGTALNPRIAAIWSPSKVDTVKFIFGQAFRAPNVYEQYWTDGVTQKQNPDLEPERVKTYEAIWEHRIGELLRVIGSGYYYGIDDLISVTTDPADGLDYFTNIGRASGVGLDLEVAAVTTRGVELRASYSLQHAREGDTGSRLPNSPHHLAKANVSCPLVERKVFAGVEALFQGRRAPNLPDHSTPGGAHALVNATLSTRRLFGGVDLSASVYNLLDTKYFDLGGPEHLQDLLPQPGRSARLKATWSF